jgi:hypothetical protein
LIGPWYKVFLIPAVGAIIFFLNVLLAYGLYIKERTAAYILLVAAVAAQCLLFFAAHLITTFI